MHHLPLILCLLSLAGCTDSTPLVAEGGSADAAREPSPEEVAEFLQRSFIDQDGRAMRLADLSGKAVLLSYVYTSCPIQTMCPLTTKKMAEMQGALPEEIKGRVHFVSITLDPQRDPPEALKGYGEFYGADFDTWSFLTSDEDAIRESASCCNVTFSLEDNGMIGHNMNLVLLSPAGQIANQYPGIDWKVPAVIATLREMLAASPRHP